MKNKFKNNEKGFALQQLLLLVVMMLVLIKELSHFEHKANTDKDSNQQVFYAAESGISVAKKYMVDNTSLITGSSQRNLDGDLKFCKASFFPNLRTSNGFHFDKQSLNEVISASGDEATRLGKFSFEYFIAYSPDVNGNNSSAKKKSGTNNTLYTIYSCGCNESKDKCSAQSNIIVPLEAVVTLIN